MRLRSPSSLIAVPRAFLPYFFQLSGDDQNRVAAILQPISFVNSPHLHASGTARRQIDPLSMELSSQRMCVFGESPRVTKGMGTDLIQRLLLGTLTG